MRSCDTCKHEKKSAVQDPCRNCLPSPSLPAWESAAVEKTPAARIAELEAEVERLKEELHKSPKIIGIEYDPVYVQNLENIVVRLAEENMHLRGEKK
jgi:hypothetical protein